MLVFMLVGRILDAPLLIGSRRFVLAADILDVAAAGVVGVAAVAFFALATAPTATATATAPRAFFSAFAALAAIRARRSLTRRGRWLLARFELAVLVLAFEARIPC